MKREADGDGEIPREIATQPARRFAPAPQESSPAIKNPYYPTMNDRLLVPPQARHYSAATDLLGAGANATASQVFQ
jgi:hypothetical protein